MANQYGQAAGVAPDPNDPASMTAFYQQPNVQQFLQGMAQEYQRVGGKNAFIPVTLWAQQHAKDYGVTDDQLRAMNAMQNNGYAYDAQSQTVKPIDSTLAKVGKFFLGYVMPVVGTAFVGPALAGVGAPTAVNATVNAAVDTAQNTATDAAPSPGDTGGETGDPGYVDYSQSPSIQNQLDQPPVGTQTPSGGPSSLVKTLAGPAANVAGNLISSWLTSSATKDAAALQQKSFEEALAYEKQRDAYLQTTEANRYGAQFAQRAPYVASGQNANTAMASYIGLPAPPPQAPIQSPPTYAAPPPPGYQGPTATGQGAGQLAGPTTGTAAPGVATGTPMITMRAPDGTTKQIPADQEQHYTQLGAVRVS